MGRAKRKSVFEHAQNVRIHISLHMRKVSSRPLLSAHFVVSNDSGSRQRKSWSDCADAQADLGLRCPHMPEDAFLHGATMHVNYKSTFKWPLSKHVFDIEYL